MMMMMMAGSVRRKNRYAFQPQDAPDAAVSFRKCYAAKDSPRTRIDDSVHRKNRYTVQPPDAPHDSALLQKTATHEHSGTQMLLDDEKE